MDGWVAGARAGLTKGRRLYGTSRSHALRVHGLGRRRPPAARSAALIRRSGAAPGVLALTASAVAVTGVSAPAPTAGQDDRRSSVPPAPTSLREGFQNRVHAAARYSW